MRFRVWTQPELSNSHCQCVSLRKTGCYALGRSNCCLPSECDETWFLVSGRASCEGGAQRALSGACLRTKARRGGSEQSCSRLLPEHVPAELLRHHRLQPAPLRGPLPGQPLPAKPGGPPKARRGRAACSTVGHVRLRAPVPGRAGPGRGRSRTQQRTPESAPEGKFRSHLVCSGSLNAADPEPGA